MGEETARINQPVFSDSGNDRATNNIEGAYKLTQTGPNTYLIYIVIPSSWLLNPARVYPVVIDPSVNTNSGAIVNSCYYPAYQSSNLAITVPAGTITNTYLRWDFRAVDATIGWLEDQRSYVSGPNGSTGVFIGTGTTSGLQIYSTNTTIANNNAHPGGNINFTFYASRVWGGSACDNVYNYLEYRYISVTYYTSTCNNFLNFHSNVNGTGYAPCGSWSYTSTIGPGQHQLHYAYYGSSYSINTCGTNALPSFDTQITAYQGGSSIVYYNDDASSSCTSNGFASGSLDSWVDWTAPFNGWVQIQITRYNCNPWTSGVGSAILRVRENPPPQPSAPTLDPPGGTYCAGSNVLLEAVGNPPVGVTWYWQTTSTGTSTTNSGSTYTVSSTGTYYLRPRTASGCWGTASAGVTATFFPGISNNSISANQTICSGTSPATLVGSTPSGGLGAGTYNYGWQMSTDGGLTWFDCPVPNTGINYSSGNLTTTTRFKRWIQSGPCPASESNVVIITVEPTIDGGTVASNQSICYNTTPATFTGTSASGGNGTYAYQWQQQPACTGAWSDISGATAITYNYTGNLTQTTCYRRWVTSGVCPGTNSNSITVTVYPDLTPGSVATNQSICYNTSPSTFTSTTLPTGGTGSYNYQWQQQPLCSGGWADITGATATTYDYTGNLTQTTCYRRRVISGSCTPVYSNIITVTVHGNLDPGTVGTNQSICYNTSPAAFTNIAMPSGGTGSLDLQWQLQPGCSGGWSNISGATASTYNHTSNLIQTTCFRRRVVNICGTDYSNIIQVTIYPDLTPGTVGSNQSICYNTSPASFTNLQSPTGGTGPFTYQWQQQPGCSGAWSNISGATASTYVNASSMTQTTCYRRVVTNTCGSVNSNPVSVTIYAQLTPGSIGSNQTICSGNMPAPFTSTANASGGAGSYNYQWQITTVAGCGSGWSDISGANSNIYNHNIPLTQTTCFRRRITDPCGGPLNSNTITITVNPTPSVSFSGLGGPYCINQVTAVPLSGNPSGGTFSGNGIVGNNFYPYLAAVGSNLITYTYTNAQGCTNSQTQTAQVNGLPIVNFTGLSGPYCINDNTPKPLTGFPSGGTFSGLGISGNNFIPSLAGIGFHQITYTYQDGNGCINSQNQSVHVSELPAITIIGLEPSYCIDDPIDILSGFPSGGTFSGPGIFGNTFNPVSAGVGIKNIVYTFTNGYGCTNTTTHQTTVYPSPIVSFSGLLSNYCQNNPPVLLTGNPSGGTFSGTGVSGNYFYPSITGVGTFNITYTYTNANNCSNSQTQAVTVNPTPVITSADSIATCSGQSVNYNITSTLPGTTYTWTSTLILGSASGYSNGSGTTINNVIVNNTLSAAIVKYVITPTTSGPPPCTGDQHVLLVYVRPYPSVFAGNDALICSNTPYTISDATTDTANTILWTHNGLGTFNNATIMHPTYIPSTAESGNIMLFMTVTNPLGCPKTDTMVLTIDFAPIANAGNNQTINCGGSGVTIGSPSQPNYVYNWSPTIGLSNPNVAQPNANPLSNTTYILMVTDTVNGCFDYDTMSVTVAGAPVANAGANQNINCGGAGVLIGSIGIPGLSYSWTPSNTLSNPNIPQPIATPLSNTTYVLTVTNLSTGCFATDDIAITVIGAPIANAGPDQFVNCGGSTGVVIGSTAISGMAYNWQPTAGLNNPNIAQPTANPLSNTTYILTVTDLGTGCYSTDSMIITVIGAPLANAGLDQSINCGGTGTMIGTTGVLGLSYNWLPSTGLSNPNIAQPIASPLSNTNYQLIVTDLATGCFATDEMNITVIGAPYANAGSDQSILCGGIGTTIGTTVVSGMGYSWSPTNGLSNPNIAQPTATPLGTTTYIVTVTDLATGCYSTDNVTITVIGTPTANSGLDQSINCGGSGTQIGTPGVTGMAYNWFPSTGLNNPNIAQPIATPLTHTTYTLIVTDLATGCYATDDIHITVIGAPLANAGSNQTIGCGGPGTTIGTSVVNGMSYTWSPSYALSATNVAQPTATPLGNTTYYLTVTNTATGCYGIDSVTITVAGAPTANAGVDQSVNCGGSGVLLGTTSVAGMSYTWAPTYGLNNPNIAQPTSTPLGNTVYHLTVTDIATGCFGTDMVIVNVSGTPTANAGVNQSIPCGGPGVQIGTPLQTGLTYSWNPSYGLNNNSLAMPLATPYATTNYYLTVSDINTGCFATDMMTLTVAGLPSVNAGPDAEVCANDTFLLTGASSSNSLVLWTHNGIGNLQNYTTVSPTYLPMPNEFGNITLTLTAVCNTDTANDDMVLTIYPYPIASFSELDSAYCIDNPGDLLIGYPTGGTFTGAGISGDFFSPASAGTGNHNISYIYTDVNGCTKDTIKPTIVNPLPVVSFSGLSPHYCVYNASYLVGTPSGGTFSGPGMVNNIFYPSISGTGTFNITYSYQDANGCINSQTQQTTVTPLPNTDFTGLALEYCVDDNPVTLTGIPAGGTFTGPGISGNVFDPSIAGVGNHVIFYLYEDSYGCQNDISKVVDVHPLPVVYFSGLSNNYCVNSLPVTLSGFPSGGTFSGPGISGSTFSPSVAGAGTHTITYTYIDNNTCVGVTQSNVTIFALTPVSFTGLDSNYCLNYLASSLTGTPFGGTFSGNGISGTIFNPAIAGAGTSVITYTHIDGNGCTNFQSQQTMVHSLTPVSLSGLPSQYCFNGTALTLTGTPTGGVFTGPGISGSSFNPSIAGVGIHTIIYTYVDSNICTNSDSSIIQVLPLPTVSFIGLQTEYCVDALPVSLTGFPTGGTFTGPGINATIFNPGIAGVGTHNINYSFTDGNSCTNTYTLSVIVHGLPVVTLDTFADICHNAPPLVLTGGLPLGGTYSGIGVTNNIFNPDASGSGLHNIVYSYQDANSCINSDTQDIFVIAQIPMTVTGLSAVYCLNDTISILTGTPSGGYFFGPGINGNTFNPTLAGAGIHNIGYVYTGTNPCTDTLINIVEVLPLPIVSIGGLDTLYCVDAPSATIVGFPLGGTYSGPGVSGNIFTPSDATVGIHEIYYIYTDSLGCRDTATHVVEVAGLPVLVLFPIPDVCMYDAPFVLNQGYPVGGTYSGIGVYSGSFNPLLAGGGAHIVTYTYEDAYGCINSISDTVIVHVNPTVTFDLPFNDICSNDHAVVLSGGIPLGGTYSGMAVNSGEFIPPLSTTGPTFLYYTYMDTVNGCSTTDSSFLMIHQAPTVFAGDDISICEGESYNLTAIGADFYFWSTLQTTSEINVTPILPTEYTVIGFSYVNNEDFICSDTDSVFINIIQLPEVTLTSSAEDNIAGFGEEITFTASPSIYEFYEFYVNYSLVQAEIINTFITSSLEGENVISVIAKDSTCMSNPDSLHIRVKSVANAFTPNNDGKNDLFMKNYNLEIFNRWGQLLYEGFDGWDGTYNGEPLPGGTFYFVAKIFAENKIDVRAEIRGSVLLIREEEQ
ncbi:MAG: gliding motility-associated C-terminal domain-containing protein [Bacteroidales bacterium]|nr:gliding motility-associated C-terminal domain-containing protein [Bacteroidales bacterium]